jgi:hypothetical protein
VCEKSEMQNLHKKLLHTLVATNLCVCKKNAAVIKQKLLHTHLCLCAKKDVHSFVCEKKKLGKGPKKHTHTLHYLLTYLLTYLLNTHTGNAQYSPIPEGAAA